MCYASSFAASGVTGPNRVATFSSDADHLSYETGRRGSDFFYYMVQVAIVHRAADASIEEAFDYARMRMSESGSTPGPVMSDGTSGTTTL